MSGNEELQRVARIRLREIQFQLANEELSQEERTLLEDEADGLEAGLYHPDEDYHV